MASLKVEEQMLLTKFAKIDITVITTNGQNAKIQWNIPNQNFYLKKILTVGCYDIKKAVFQTIF